MLTLPEDEVPVLIVGAGPAGVTAGILLSRYGIPVLVAERRRHHSTQPKATVVSTRTMEIMRSWGLDRAVLAGGVDVEWKAWSCHTLARAAEGYGAAVGYPTREQASRVSPSFAACVPQDHLEPVLLSRLRSMPSAEVRLGVEVQEIQQFGDGVRARLYDRAIGQSRSVRARYLLAADGAHSTIRDTMGISMHGPERVMAFVQAVFRAPLWDLLGPIRYGLYAVDHPGGEGTFLPAGVGDRWLFGAFVGPEQEPVPPNPEVMTARIRHGAGVPELPVHLERTSGVIAGAQLAARFRADDVFLMGDAAHRVSPRGGTGMNLAIHGAYDLGWKLAWVLRGWAGSGLLDSYEAERRSSAAHYVARSADPDGSRRDVDGELAVDLGGRLPHVWLDTPGGTLSTLDLIGPGLTLFTAPRSTGWAAVAAALPGALPVAVRSLPASAADVLDLREGALLVRPDGRTVARWVDKAEPGRALVAAVDDVCRQTRTGA